MTKTLIIPDLHNKIEKADAIIANESHDSIVFLGDNFDEFEDTPEDVRRTAIWLKESLNDPKRIHLKGNHDLSYMYSFNSAVSCSGFTREKDYHINQVMNREDWDKMKWYHAQDNILFSHAGLSAKLIKKYGPGVGKDGIQTIEQTVSWLDGEIHKALERLDNKEPHWLYGCGWSRGGHQSIGGLTWGDFNIDHLPTPFIQCFGHSPHPKVDLCLRKPGEAHIEYVAVDEVGDRKLSDYWWSLDLDTHLNGYAIIDNGVLTTKMISWEGNSIGYVYDTFQYLL